MVGFSEYQNACFQWMNLFNPSNYLGDSNNTNKSNFISVDDLPNKQFNAYAGQNRHSSWEQSIYDGEKFFGGYGATQLLNVDYWTLRKRSKELFTTNLYARGLLKRLITNEINTGLMPEARPDEEIIGLPEDALADWTETVENRFGIWSENPQLCDYSQQSTFGALQRAARLEALISGDVLCVLRKTKVGLPSLQLISGEKVKTPTLDKYDIPDGHYIKHGVEFNVKGQIHAFWIEDSEDTTYERLLAYGSRSKRKQAWLVYGTEKMLDDVRGQPMLSLVIQSLKEIDRYRDSTQRKASNNSYINGYIEKTQDKPSSLPVTGGSVRKDTATVTDSGGGSREFNITHQMPGLFVEQLQAGETIKLMDGSGTDINFGQFEEVIIQAVAWANEVPPEILRLAFSNNYSASQAAINEFKIYLNKVWSDFGETFCKPIYVEWLLSEVLLGKIVAKTLLQAWRNPMMYDVYGAWIASDWYGSIKPSTDMLKQAKGSKLLVNDGWSTNAREARITTGTKFSQNMKRIKRENELKVEAMRPIADFEKEFSKVDEAQKPLDKKTMAKIDDYLEDVRAEEELA